MAQRFNTEEIFELGIQIEKNGVSFYATAAENTVDQGLKDLFLRLSDWERTHVTLFENLRMKLPPGTGEFDLFDQDNMVHLYLRAVADNNIFVKGLTLGSDHVIWTSPVAVLRTALDFEKDSVVFFSSLKEIMDEKTGISEVEKIIHEELNHIGFLTGEIRKLEK